MQMINQIDPKDYILGSVAWNRGRWSNCGKLMETYFHVVWLPGFYHFYSGPKLLPVTHVMVDTWMLTAKPVYKLTRTTRSTGLHTPFILLRHNWHYLWFWKTLFAPFCFTCPPIFLTIYKSMVFIRSKWQEDGSLLVPSTNNEHSKKWSRLG